MKNILQLHRDLHNITARNSDLLDQLHEAIWLVECAHNYLSSVHHVLSIGLVPYDGYLPIHNMRMFLNNKLTNISIECDSLKSKFHAAHEENVKKAYQIDSMSHNAPLSSSDLTKIIKLYHFFFEKTDDIELLNSEIRLFRKARAPISHSVEPSYTLQESYNNLRVPKPISFRKKLFAKLKRSKKSGTILPSLRNKMAAATTQIDRFGCFDTS